MVTANVLMNAAVTTPSSPVRHAHSRRELAVGLVGPGRTRNGLGPFLARHLAAAGARVVAVAGRDLVRTQPAAAALAAQLGHDVAAYGDVARLVARGDLDALVICTPIAAHLHALQLALAARLPTLCEKPLADAGDTAAACTLIEGFAAAGVPLVENCQWPFALAALRRAGVCSTDSPGAFGMRLSPSQPGRDMLTESVSHPLSLLQDLVALDAESRVSDVSFSGSDTALRVVWCVRGRDLDCDVTLDLVHTPDQPRPAWFALNGVRVTRQIELPHYYWCFEHADGTHSVGDPQAALVYSFVQLISQPDLDLARTHAAAIATRARFFAAIVGAYDAMKR
jgi:hypothetical protein